MNAAYAMTPSRRALALVSVSGVALAASAVCAQSSQQTPATPLEVTLVGVVRDFRSSTQGGHADFQRQPTAGFGHYMGMVKNALDPEGKPVWDGTGKRVNTQWKDAQGKNRIMPKPYLSAMAGDVNGSISSTQGGACTSAANLAQWFRDVPGVNMSDTLPIKLRRAEGSDKFVFDDKLDPDYSALGGFFPINGAMYGNFSNGRNYHFSVYLGANFTYEAGKGQTFAFIGDDDVWVFIDGKLVVDLGGVHSAVHQHINVDRIAGLQNGQVYSLDFFFAERHTTQSNFRIETNLKLVSVSAPQTTALYD